MNADPLPYLTNDIEPIAASFRSRPEDFRVDELLAFEPDGEGEHLMVRFEKTGLSTRAALRGIDKRLKLGRGAYGTAGQKDARAITTQHVTIEGARADEVARLDVPGLRVLGTVPHGRKLRTGQLAGNRFEIRLRGVPPFRVDDLHTAAERLRQRGVPNYFGQQRFGNRGDTALLGRQLLKGEFAEAVRTIAGRPSDRDHGRVKEARILFEARSWRDAARTWPHGYEDAARLCMSMARFSGRTQQALFSMEREDLRFYVSAYQAHLFNAVLAERMPAIDRLLAGDWAVRHEEPGMFPVEDVEREQPRATAFEISPTAPLFGAKVGLSAAEAGAVETRVLAAADIAPEDFGNQRGSLKSSGSRRALRVRVADLALEEGSDGEGAFTAARFMLPSGSYATSLLRELLKNEGSPPPPPVAPSAPSTP